jgi:hypothetical protein
VEAGPTFSTLGGVTTFGAAAALSSALSSTFVGLVHVELREGSVADAGAHVHEASLGVGLRTRLYSAEPIGLFFRADALARHDDLARRTEGIGPVHQDRWTPAAAVRLEEDLHLVGRFAVVASIGAELAFVKADVFIGDTRVASLPFARMVGSIGVRMRL